MTIRLDHTIVPAKDKVASAGFFAEIFGLRVKPGPGYFAQVRVNESLTFDFADEPEPWGGPGFDPRTLGIRVGPRGSRDRACGSQVGPTKRGVHSSLRALRRLLGLPT